MKAEPEANRPYQAVLPSPLPGTPYLGLRIDAGRLIAMDYLEHEVVPAVETDDSAICSEVEHYFAGQARQPDVPLLLKGTAFQQRVWRRLQRIPPGRVVTYGELARELNTAARAVAGACRANPVPVIIPCHRVIAAQGLGGYMGETGGRPLAIKQWLLQHEGYV